MTTTARTPTTRTPGCRKEEDDGAEEEAQKTSRSDVEEKEEREEGRKTNEKVWESAYSPDYIYLLSHLEDTETKLKVDRHGSAAKSKVEAAVEEFVF